jgi:hypothetical protein
MPTTGGSIDGLLTVASWAMGLGVLLVALARSPSRRACQLSPLPAGDSISTPSTTGPPRVAEGPEAGGVTASTSPPRSCEGPYAALYEQLLDHRAELARKLAELHSTSGVAAGPSALGD